ncbi:hypothetical protein OAP32_00665 [Crocinitomicaceae bacterium]|nr:hypothetical protein [Crocinitomicaceae bacterium]
MATSDILAELNTAMLKIMEDINAGDGTVRNLAQLTEVSLTGEGVFDVLMRAGKLHIQEEFDNNRIVNNDYAQTYLGMMQGAMQSAIQFLIAWDKADLEKTNIAATTVATLNQSLLSEQQAKLAVAQINLYNQKTVTELAETTTTLPAGITPGGDLTNIVPYAPTKVAGIKGANRDVALEQRAGYMRKAQNDLIKVSTGHVDMLVSSGSATNVGDYTADLLELLRTGAPTSSFPASSLLSIAVTDAASLRPSDADSVD